MCVCIYIYIYIIDANIYICTYIYIQNFFYIYKKILKNRKLKKE